MCNRLEFSPRYPNFSRFHVDLAENWIERLIDTRGFHGKGLFFSLYSGDDVIYGGDGDDCIDAGSGEDLVFGGIGNDTLEGGNHSDLLDGGLGNDYIDGGLDPVCYFSCEPLGNFCELNSDCCSNKCKGKQGSKTCK